MVEHFKQLEKHSDKQLKLLERNTQQFLNKLGDIIETQKTESAKEAFEPIPLDTNSVENTIEKEEEKEVNLEDTNRIPIVEGVKIKFEDEEEVYPINISSAGQFIDQQTK